MQRCPYIHEMRERLLCEQRESVALEPMERANLLDNRQSAESNQVGTVVKLHADGYHTSPAHQRTPLVPRDLGEDFNLDFDDDFPIDAKRPKNANSELETVIVSPPPKSSYCYTIRNSGTNPSGMSRSCLPYENRGSHKKHPMYYPNELWTSLFIVTSLVYAIILIVVCIAYVISDVTTHRLPVLYYEGFFTYLYGASILFLLYVFCFLLQESTCCNGGSKPKSPPKEKKSKKQKQKKPDPADSKDGKGNKDSGKGGKPSPFQDSQAEVEAAVTPKNVRKRKTTHSDPTHGSFFLRVGAIAFGLGAMIYIGLEFGSFFEIPFESPCHHILIGVNPLLQMVFTFMQMYFIFMNARLNIHRFKVIARFGLMHVVATNICVWIRTMVKESLHEITIYHQRRGLTPEDSIILESIRRHTLRHAGTVLRTHIGPNDDFEMIDTDTSAHSQNVLSKMVRATAEGVTRGLTADNIEMMTTARGSTPTTSTPSTTQTTTTELPSTTAALAWASTTMARKLKKFITSTTTTSTTSTTTTTTTEAPATHLFQSTVVPSHVFDATTGESSTPSLTTFHTPSSSLASFFSALTSSTPSASSTENGVLMNNLFGGLENSYQTFSGISHPEPVVPIDAIESLDNIYPAALSSSIGTLNSTACGRVDIMGTIVYDSAPYLYPFIIEYSLIGAVVLYVMWKHIGRYPRHMNDEDLEHRLEVMLSRRAVAMAQQARSGRVDCVGSSKGLFFGLLLLVGSLICLILFFVLVRHPQFSLLAIYLADASHCALMAFAVLAIIIGFIRVKSLKFRCEEQSNLNDILLRISAFGLFTYSVFSVIAGSLKALESEPNLLVMITGIGAVFQVVLQLLFIADVSRRRVHLPEHDRSKPGRQIVTFLLICNVSMFAIYTFEAQKVFANPVQLDFYGFVPWSIIQRVTLPLCIFHRFHSAVTLAEIWKTTYKARLE
ncbi:proton channel OtopLc isoform X4 [Eupeodes corollae]|uniref:proton channel OtopLc isoform X4 n=1 Tax=Eupeodes corollae TaxID=290404 RepID=UPI0024937066|nr:proton channel OtopLc isoform X4 [Eupeodes corollae]